MSFVCPKCGFRDSPCWRASHWFLYTLTCKIDELDQFEPEIAKILREKKEVEIGAYYYKMSKFGRVYRVIKELKGEYKRGHWQEKPKPPGQTKLSEERVRV
jgi:hypothetical protein